MYIEVEECKPYADICPVCKGGGMYREYRNYTNCVYIERQCHGCGGKGWVELGGKKDVR